MKTFGACPATEFSTPIEAKFIRKIEQFRDDEIRLVLRDGVAAHPITCITEAKYSYAPKTAFRMAHSDDSLVVMFEVEENHLRGLATNRDNVQDDSCVGLYIESPIDYGVFSFEINCIGTLRAMHRSTPLTEDILAQIRIHGSLAYAPIDSRGEGQTWWMVMVIPFSVLGLQQTPSVLRCNLYKRGDKCDRPHHLTWITTDNFGEIHMA